MARCSPPSGQIMPDATPSQPVGRFAPTPSGLLHFGSLLAALASYLDIKHRRGQWLVRLEDLDLPRNQPGAAEHILDTLDRYGLRADGEILRQSQRTVFYQQQIDHWLASGQAYYCNCSRADLAGTGGVYPGTCRERHLPAQADHAVRLRVNDQPIAFIDRLQGPFSQKLESQVGDFVIRRRDGIIAYQLAVVLDDIAQGVTEIVRGADLLDSTPRQLWIYQLLEQPAPSYLHIPLIMRADGEKLSKRLTSTPISTDAVSATLFQALQTLAQKPPPQLLGANPSEQLAWAVAHWRPMALPASRQLLQTDLPH